MHINEIR